MASQTTNYHLIKPAGTESASIAIINQNMDTIDSTMKTIDNKINDRVDANGSGKSWLVGYDTNNNYRLQLDNSSGSPVVLLMSQAKGGGSWTNRELFPASSAVIGSSVSNRNFYAFGCLSTTKTDLMIFVPMNFGCKINSINITMCKVALRAHGVTTNTYGNYIIPTGTDVTDTNTYTLTVAIDRLQGGLALTAKMKNGSQWDTPFANNTSCAGMVVMSYTIS